MFQKIHEQWQLDEQFPFVLFESSEKQEFLHYHNCLELNLVIYGKGSYMIDGRKYPICRGDVFVINNQEPHMAIEQKNLRMMVLLFDVDLLWRSKGVTQFLSPFLLRKKKFSHRIKANGRYGLQMAELFQKMAEEYKKREKGWQMAIESLLMYLLTLLYRCYDEKQELDEEAASVQNAYVRIREVFHFIEDNFQNAITLEQLAQFVSLSPSYLCKCFKRVTGRTLFEYIEQMRIQYSCYLLRTGEQSITEIALEVGFNSVSYYNRIFKKYRGQSPKEFKKNLQNQPREFKEPHEQ